MAEKVQVNIMMDKEIHKALKKRAVDEDKKIKELTHEILANALGVEEEAKANG